MPAATQHSQTFAHTSARSCFLSRTVFCVPLWHSHYTEKIKPTLLALTTTLWCVHFRRQQHHTIFPGIRRDFRATRNGPVLALAVPEAPPNDRRHFAQSATGRTVAFSGLSTGLRSTTATAAAIRFRVEKEMLAGYYKSADRKSVV